MAKTLFKLEHS